MTLATPAPTTHGQNVRTAIAGEFFVAGELSKRGWIATLTSRNTPGFDILAKEDDRFLRIDVKTRTSGFRHAWQVGGVHTSDPMKNTSIEVDVLHESYDGQPALLGESFAVGSNGIFGTAGRERRRPLMCAQLQASVLVDRLRVGEALRPADRPCPMFARAAALYGIRHVRATLGWVADVRLILRDPGVSLVRVCWCRAAGGW